MIGAALLAQGWWLGPGPADAAEQSPPGLIGTVDGAPAALGGVGGGTVSAVRQGAEHVARLVRDRIRAGGLPLPGQAAAVPDAFAIAATLLPAVPPPPREGGGDVSGPVPAAADRPTPGPAPSSGPARPHAPKTVPAAPPPPPGRSAPGGRPPHSPSGAAGTTGAGRPGGPLATAPALASDTDTAVAVWAPITAGLLLTGLAMYKHRGLPRGH